MSTGIQWTDETWNPLRGCSRVSEGCRNCYAEKTAKRFSGPGMPYEGLTNAQGRWNGTIRVVDEAMTKPLAWKKPRRVFVNSMSDLFHENVADETIDRIFAVMALAPQHTFQVLTKRPERMRGYVASRNGHSSGVSFAAEKLKPSPPPQHWYHAGRSFTWPLPNVWLGVSVEDQPTADLRIPLLLQTPAAVRFISAEPLLGPIDLEAVPLPTPGADVYGLRGVLQPIGEKDTEPDDWKYWTRRSARLDWVIVGGESGHGARVCDVGSVRSLVEQCTAAGVACFVKQMGARPMVFAAPLAAPQSAESIMRHGEYGPDPWPLELRDSKGGDMAEWPEDLRVRQFPEVRA